MSHIKSKCATVSMVMKASSLCYILYIYSENHIFIAFTPLNLNGLLLNYILKGGLNRWKITVRKSSSLQLWLQLNDLNPNLGLGCYEDIDLSKNYSGNIWDYSDNEVVPASSWSALPNRYDFAYWFSYCNFWFWSNSCFWQRVMKWIWMTSRNSQ